MFAYENASKNPIFMHSGKIEIYYIFKTVCVTSVLFSTQSSSFHNFIFLCSSNFFFL